jgi:hypothetical protein
MRCCKRLHPPVREKGSGAFVRMATCDDVDRPFGRWTESGREVYLDRSEPLGVEVPS